MQGVDVWSHPQEYTKSALSPCDLTPGLSAGQRRLCQLRQVSLHRQNGRYTAHKRPVRSSMSACRDLPVSTPDLT